MEMKLRSLMVALLMMFSSAVYAMDCDVEYKARKSTKDKNWYGSVEKPKFKAGVVSGTGRTRAACANNALRPLKQDGWNIKHWKIIKTD